MLQDARIDLCLMGGLVTALKNNDPDAFMQWITGVIADLGEPAVARFNRMVQPVADPGRS